jgi:hypothetical protein
MFRRTQVQPRRLGLSATKAATEEQILIEQGVVFPMAARNCMNDDVRAAVSSLGEVIRSTKMEICRDLSVIKWTERFWAVEEQGYGSNLFKNKDAADRNWPEADIRVKMHGVGTDDERQSQLDVLCFRLQI